jgi:hypothetical protein
MVLSLLRLEFCSFPQHSDSLWGPPNVLCYEYCFTFLLEPSRWSVKLTTHFHIVMRLEYMELYCHLYTRLHDIVLNQTVVNFKFYVTTDSETRYLSYLPMF